MALEISLLRLLFLAIFCGPLVVFCGADKRASCMSQWLVKVGMAEEAALTYSTSHMFRNISTVSVHALRNTHHALVLDALGFQRSDRDLILACANKETCPIDQCGLEGRCQCLFSNARGAFTCQGRDSSCGKTRAQLPQEIQRTPVQPNVERGLVLKLQRLLQKLKKKALARMKAASNEASNERDLSSLLSLLEDALVKARRVFQHDTRSTSRGSNTTPNENHAAKGGCVEKDSEVC